MIEEEEQTYYVRDIQVKDNGPVPGNNNRGRRNFVVQAKDMYDHTRRWGIVAEDELTAFARFQSFAPLWGITIKQKGAD